MAHGNLTASTLPATAAAAASSRSRRTAFRSTVRSAGARPAKGWALSKAPITAALLHDPKLSLGEGAVALWPDAGSTLFPRCSTALRGETGVPLDVPFEQLNARAAANCSARFGRRVDRRVCRR